MLTQVVARVRTAVPRKRDDVIVVADCPNACGQYLHPRVDLSDADDPIVRNLPAHCPRCGAMVDTPATIRNVVGTARNWIETRHLLGLGSAS